MAGLGSSQRTVAQRQTFFLDVNRHLAKNTHGPKVIAAVGRQPDDSQRKYKKPLQPDKTQDVPPIPLARQFSPKARSPAGVTGPRKPTVAKELFKQMDTNKDGTISYSEFSRGLARHGIQEKLSNIAYGSGGFHGQDSGTFPSLHKNDPLNLKEPPRSILQDSTSNRHYGIGGLDTDSLAGDVEVLLMQKQLLSEEAQWWDKMARSESALRPNLQEDLRAKEEALKAEVADIQRQIQQCKEEHNYYDTQTRELSNETRDYLSDANAAQAEMEALRKILVNSGVPEAQLRAALSKASSPQSAQRGIRQQLRKEEFDDDDNVEEFLSNATIKGGSAALGDTIDLGKVGFA